MKIAIASKGDPSSIATWSNIPYHIIQFLKKRGHEFVYIDLKPVKEPWYYDWYRRYYSRLNNQWFLSSVEPYVLKKIGEQFDEAVAQTNPDLVLVIHGDFLAYTTFKTPSIIIHDTTFASLLGYYADFSKLTQRSIINGNKMYQLALDKCASAVFSAAWASNSALQDYHTPAEKVYTIPLGANLMVPPDREEVEQYIRRRHAESDTLKLLFLGKDWKRKGWADALSFVKILNKKGVKSQLIAVGCEPVIAPEDASYVSVRGFYDKNKPEQKALFEKILEESHALLLPSLAECYGCVYCEANAYGLPALGRETGGIPEIIRENRNGLMLRAGETVEKFADRWLAIWNDPEAYRVISQSARQEFEQRLNYEVFTDKLEQVFQKVVANQQVENL